MKVQILGVWLETDNIMAIDRPCLDDFTNPHRYEGEKQVFIVYFSSPTIIINGEKVKKDNGYLSGLYLGGRTTFAESEIVEAYKKLVYLKYGKVDDET